MDYPYRIIESKISSREQFQLSEGYQPTHALFYLKSGSFTIEIDGMREEIRSGDCVILPDYVGFRRSVLKPIEFVYVKFAARADCRYSLSIPYGKITFKDRERFESSISAMETLIVNDSAVAVGYREHLLMDILFQIHFEQREGGEMLEKKQYSDRLVSDAVKYIADRLGNKLLIDDICAAVGSNPSTLNYKFHRELGLSCGMFIMDERMKKARHLLISTTYNVSEIASRCGFENVYYFSNAFKKENGCSPSEFRKNYHS